jgi:hypothetical protein
VPRCSWLQPPREPPAIAPDLHVFGADGAAEHEPWLVVHGDASTEAPVAGDKTMTVTATRDGLKDE